MTLSIIEPTASLMVVTVIVTPQMIRVSMIGYLRNAKKTSMYYVITKGGGRGSAKCLCLLTGGRGGRGHAYVIIIWKKKLNSLYDLPNEQDPPISTQSRNWRWRVSLFFSRRYLTIS